MNISTHNTHNLNGECCFGNILADASICSCSRRRIDDSSRCFHGGEGEGSLTASLLLILLFGGGNSPVSLLLLLVAVKLLLVRVDLCVVVAQSESELRTQIPGKKTPDLCIESRTSKRVGTTPCPSYIWTYEPRIRVR